jgi:tetratricopeptide (TPR) repeat protein
MLESWRLACLLVVSVLLTACGGREDGPRVIQMRDVHIRALEATGRYDDAIVEGDRIIASAGEAFGPTSMPVASAMLNTTRMRMRVGDVATAVAQSEQALEILGAHIDKESREYVYARTSHALALMAARRFAEALPELDAMTLTVEKIYGSNVWDAATMHLQRAVALANLGRVDEARAALAIPIDPSEEQYDPLWVNRMQGSVAMLIGDYDIAVTRLLAAKELLAGPKTAVREPPILTFLGLAQLERGDAAAALATLTRAQQVCDQLGFRMHPAYADILTGLGRAQIELRSPAAAIAPLERADAFWREFDANNVAGGATAYWLARAYALNGRKADADAAQARARALLVHSPLVSDARLLASRD